MSDIELSTKFLEKATLHNTHACLAEAINIKYDCIERLSKCNT